MSFPIYALSIGVSEIQGEAFDPLYCAQNDALFFSRAMRAWGVPEENISIFLNQQATEKAIYACLDSLKNKDHPFIFVLFYSGHGYRFSPPTPKSILLLHDSPACLDTLVKNICELNAQSIYLFIDACHLRINTLLNPAWEKEVAQKSFFCLLSSGIYQSFEDEQSGFGYFTRSLIQGLEFIRNNDNTPMQLLEKITQFLKAKNLPLPEMYNIDTYRIDLFSQCNNDGDLFGQICSCFMSQPQKIVHLGKNLSVDHTLFCKNIAANLDRTFYFDYFPQLEDMPKDSLVIIDVPISKEQLERLIHCNVFSILTSKSHATKNPHIKVVKKKKVKYRFNAKILFSSLFLIFAILGFFYYNNQSPSIIDLPSSYQNFVGREEVLKEIGKKLSAHNQVLLCGPPGIGKSETAIQFANTHLKRFSYIFWIAAGSQEIYQQSYCKLAKHLDIPISPKMDFEKIKETVHFFLENQKFRKPWLLIIDNADKKLDLPKRGNGKLLITARDPHTEGCDTIMLPPLSKKDSELLFYQILHDSDSRREWNQIAKELDFLPLALDQVLHFIRESPHISLATFNKLLNENKRDALQHMQTNTRYPLPFSTLWKKGIEELQEKSQKAYEWLTLCAYLHPDNIPMEWVDFWLRLNKNELISKTAIHVEADTILKTLANYGYINIHKKEGRFSIHRLKQHLMLLDVENKPDTAVGFLANLAKRFEKHDHFDTCDDRIELTIWEASALWLLKKQKEHLSDSENLATIFNVLGNVQLIIKRKYKDSLAFLKSGEECLNRLYPNIECENKIVNLLNQGHCYLQHGYHDEGEKAFRSGLKMAEKLSGEQSSIDQANCLLTLAILANSLDNQQQALNYCEKALQLLDNNAQREALFFKGKAFKWLACIWEDLGNYDKVLEYGLQAIELNKQLYGEKNNLHVCRIMNSIGAYYRHQGDVTRALSYHLKAYQIQEEVLSNEFPVSINTICEIARDYRAKKNYKKAFSYFNKALKQLDVLHSERISVGGLRLLVHTAETYREYNDLKNSVHYYLRALESAQQVLPNKTHSIFAKIYLGLSQTYLALDQKELGFQYLRKAECR